MFKIEFEKPEHGRLPVRILYNDIEECFDASDVPVDPILQLQEVLDSAITLGGGEVWWHLEPAGYFLNLHAEKGKYWVKLEYSINSKKNSAETIFEFLGDFDEVIIPIWRSLRKLQSHNLNQFNVSENGMNSITNQIKDRKNSSTTVAH